LGEETLAEATLVDAESLPARTLVLEGAGISIIILLGEENLVAQELWMTKGSVVEASLVTLQVEKR